MVTIDINADVGEGLNNEAVMMPYLSSCNIACGAHAGDAAAMRSVLRLALHYGTKIGAHPSFPDRANFGRKVMDISLTELSDSIEQQIRYLKSTADSLDLRLNHVKPHGALYNILVHDREKAEMMVKVVRDIDPGLQIYTPHGSVLAAIAKDRDVHVVYEAFADRNYQSDLSLVSRQHPKALITEPHEALEHVCRMILNQKVLSIEGEECTIKATTFCVHGDTPHAAELLKYIYINLPKYGIIIT